MINISEIKAKLHLDSGSKDSSANSKTATTNKPVAKAEDLFAVSSGDKKT
jgi:hypothetical protein